MTTKTALFAYIGTDKRGRESRGEIEATSISMVKAQLRKRGITAKSVRKKSKPLLRGRGARIKAADIALFTRQLATMMKAGVPLIQSFEIVADGIENPRMQKLVNAVRSDVASGNALAGALARHPEQFDDLFCSLVASGESSGTLETMLDRVATYKEKTEQLKAKIKKALTYPIAIMAVAMVVTALLLVKVVPQFAETFQSFGAELPAFTQLVLDISYFAQDYYLYMLAIIIALVYLFRRTHRKSRAFRDKMDHLLLKVPIIGGIIRHAAIARFSRTLSTTFAAGVPLVEALESTSGAAGNALYREAILQVRDDVTGGSSLYAASRATAIFPNMVLQMISIGEESGSLDDLLAKVATHYEEAVDNAVDSLSTLLEPMIMVVLAVLVGSLMLAMYLPIFMLGSVI